MMPDDPRFIRRYDPGKGKYYVLVFSLYNGVLAVTSDNIDAIMVTIMTAKEQGFLYLVSANAVDKILELNREARRRMN